MRRMELPGMRKRGLRKRRYMDAMREDMPLAEVTDEYAEGMNYINTWTAKDGDLRLSAPNACLPKTEISVFIVLSCKST